MSVTAITEWRDLHDYGSSSDDPNTYVVKKGVYRIDQEITVAESETLIIEAGTKFLFTEFVGLRVFGVFKAVGTEQEPIIFTSNGLWKNISFIGDQDFVGQSVLEHCHISKGKGVLTPMLQGLDITELFLGGGLYIDRLRPIIRNCKIWKCEAMIGGGIFAKNTQLTLVDCKIHNCKAGKSGGIHLEESENLSLKNVSIKQNSAMNYAGLYAECKHATLTNCEISESEATKKTVVIKAKKVKLDQCLFASNDGNKGDILTIEHPTAVWLKDCVFDSNPMCFIDPNRLIQINCEKNRRNTKVQITNLHTTYSHQDNFGKVIEVNNAKECYFDKITIDPLKNTDEGAIIRLAGIGNTTLKNLILKNCNSDENAAIISLHQLKNFLGKNLIITGNKSEDHAGGGIHATSCDHIKIKNSTISHNKTQEHGGAIALEDSNLTLENCKIQNNEAGFCECGDNSCEQSNGISLHGKSTCKNTNSKLAANKINLEKEY